MPNIGQRPASDVCG